MTQKLDGYTRNDVIHVAFVVFAFILAFVAVRYAAHLWLEGRW